MEIIENFEKYIIFPFSFKILYIKIINANAAITIYSSGTALHNVQSFEGA